MGDYQPSPELLALLALIRDESDHSESESDPWFLDDSEDETVPPLPRGEDDSEDQRADVLLAKLRYGPEDERELRALLKVVSLTAPAASPAVGVAVFHARSISYVRALLEHGAPADVADPRGVTPLQRLCLPIILRSADIRVRRWRLEVSLLLLRAGAVPPRFDSAPCTDDESCIRCAKE